MLKIILRGILGPVEEEEGKRNLMNHEIQEINDGSDIVEFVKGKRNLMNHEIQEINDGSDIVEFVKSQRLEWWGHIQRMEENQNPKIINKWGPNITRRKGRPKNRWTQNIREDQKHTHSSKVSKDNKQKLATGE
ncbi:hypothetical protein QE152_g8547 [Popillia japonica]